ncbi:hypothetical protein JNB88_27115 [Rhizobium cauense]|uniref:hypothetical protein n=1 Tax=Rhizobium cauense TaxID=1166683 RepID=UPI001C6F0E32|nr:hypothetical protein [Rhizobium cauense]MBW9117294.1 hypothetical protein [Rhizobium cauense]
MTAQAPKPYRCHCEECDTLPPIEGLAAPRQAEVETGAIARLGAAMQRLLRKQAPD